MFLFACVFMRVYVCVMLACLTLIIKEFYVHGNFTDTVPLKYGSKARAAKCVHRYNATGPTCSFSVSSIQDLSKAGKITLETPQNNMDN